MNYHPAFEHAREARRASDLKLTPLQRLQEAEAIAVLEGPDPRRHKLVALCRALNERRANYVVAGTAAAILWGYVRTTRDTDLLIEATEANARRVLDALTDLGLILTHDLDPADVARSHVTMIGDLYRVDLLTHAWKLRYPEAIATARIFNLDGVAVPALSLDLLIESKRTDRLQDQADIEELELLRAKLKHTP